MDFIHEGDYLPACVGDLLQHGLQSLLKLTAILCSSQHRTQIERNQPLGFEPLRYVPGCDALSKSLDDRGLSDARLTNEDGIVLRATREHLHHPTNLFVTTDDRVDLPGSCTRGEIDAVLLQGLELIFWILRRDPMRPADHPQCVQQLLARHANDLVHGKEQHFNGEKLVAELRLDLLGCCKRCRQFTIETRFCTTLCARQFGESRSTFLRHLFDRYSHLCKER